MRINQLPARQGFVWFQQAWGTFWRHPLQWVALFVVATAAPLVLSVFLPLFGGLLGEFIQTLLFLGFFQLARHHHEPSTKRIREILFAFRNSDLCVNILWLKISVFFSLLFLILLLAGIDSWLGLTIKDLMSVLQILSLQLFTLIPEPIWWIIGTHIFLILLWSLLVGAGLLFAAPLIAFSSLGVSDAFWWSLKAQWKNIGVFFALTLLLVPLTLLAILPFGMGLLVMGPVFWLTLAQAHRDLFDKRM